MKDQAAELWPQNIKLIGKLHERLGNDPKNIPTPGFKYTPGLEALLRPVTKPYQRETPLLAGALDMIADINSEGDDSDEYASSFDGDNYSKTAEGLYRGGDYIPTILDVWKPGKDDKEAYEPYKKLDLTARARRVLFLRIACRFTAKQVAWELKEPAGRLQKTYERARDKVYKTGDPRESD